MTELNTAASLLLTLTPDGISGEFSPSTFLEDDYESESSSFIFYLLFFGCSIMFVIFICGLVGNAIVIYYLCFVLKKNPITTYILNLAAADSCVLLSAAIYFFALDKKNPNFLDSISPNLLFYTHLMGGFLLAAISVEKCLLVLFPIWYRCHRLEHLSAIVCALIWAMFILLFGLDSLLHYDIIFHVISVINSICCPLVIVICTVILFIKVCCSLHQRSRGKFYVALLLALFFFLIFGVPFNALMTLLFFELLDFHDMIWVLLTCMMCPIINSSVNPFIYFLIGRGRKHRPKEPLKVVLERVFSDKSDCRPDQSSPAMTDSMTMTP